MKVHPQTHDDLSKLANLIKDLLKDLRVAMLTSTDANGALISRPMAPLEMDEQGAIWFFTDRTSPKTQQLDSLNLAFSDEENATYVSLSGRGELIDNREQMEALWTSAARPWFPQGSETPNLVLLKFVTHAAEYWDAPDSKMVRLFAMATSIAAGKPIGMGEHHTLGTLSA